MAFWRRRLRASQEAECSPYIPKVSAKAARANIDKSGHDRHAPLHCSAEQGRENVVRILLDNGASIDAKDNQGQTALIHASREGRENVALWNAATLHKEDVMSTMMSKMQKKKPEYRNLRDKNFLKHKSNKN